VPTLPRNRRVRGAGNTSQLGCIVNLRRGCGRTVVLHLVDCNGDTMAVNKPVRDKKIDNAFRDGHRTGYSQGYNAALKTLHSALLKEFGLADLLGDTKVVTQSERPQNTKSKRKK
jgi:hypothetical protein